MAWSCKPENMPITSAKVSFNDSTLNHLLSQGSRALYTNSLINRWQSESHFNISVHTLHSLHSRRRTSLSSRITWNIPQWIYAVYNINGCQIVSFVSSFPTNINWTTTVSINKHNLSFPWVWTHTRWESERNLVTCLQLLWTNQCSWFKLPWILILQDSRQY